jgi:prolyl-tRNA synthetase
VFQNVARVIREEMDAIGAQEVNFPAMLPKEPYEVTGRWTDYGDNLFRLQDRRKVDFLLGPTHEEMFTLLVKDLYSSYKDLPVWLYQIQNKFRDEARPRGGLLRGREFSMKDSYSFDLDQEGLQRSYDAHREAYVRIFERLGLPFAIVSAMSGAMGGSASEEFLFPCDIGEDTFVQCTACNYSANTEAVRVGVADAIDASSVASAKVVDTPDTPTIQTLVDLFNAREDLQLADRQWNASDTLKNVVVNLRHPDGRLEALAIGVPGDREVDLKRLEAQVSPAEVEAFDETHFAANTALVKGYIGPGVLGTNNASGIRYMLDPRVATGSAWITGADSRGKHVMDLVNGRDFTADGTLDVAEIRDDDTCPSCRSALTIKRGIEIGHVFQLGPKYAEALGLQVLDKNGKQQTVTMGSYGIGVSRAVAAIAEAMHDDSGLRWPLEVSPYDVHIVIAGKDDATITATAESLATELEGSGLKVLLDDRQGISPGVKFKDAELIGVPNIVVAGRGVANGTLEVRDRFAGTAIETPIAQVGPQLVAQARGK